MPDLAGGPNLVPEVGALGPHLAMQRMGKISLALIQLFRGKGHSLVTAWPQGWERRHDPVPSGERIWPDPWEEGGLAWPHHGWAEGRGHGLAWSVEWGAGSQRRKHGLALN